jgi:hypothetical protein
MNKEVSMIAFFRKLLRGQSGPYLQALTILLVLAAVVYYIVITTGASCYEPYPQQITSPQSRQSQGQRTDAQARLQANAQQARPGERATRILSCNGDPGTTQVSYRWTPPYGATNISYNPQPDDAGPPPIWLDRDPSEQINISYNQPPLPLGESTMLATDTATMEWDGHSSATSYTTLVTNEPSQAFNIPPEPTSHKALPSDQVSETDQIDLWEVGEWVDPRGITMTQSVCQDWVDFFESEDTFIAFRAPVSPTLAVTESYPLPIVQGSEFSNTMKLIGYGFPQTRVFTAPLTLQPERFQFLENALPSAEGEHWMALSMAPGYADCPPGLNLPADGWSFLGLGLLDMNHMPDNCEGCILPKYFCYQGDNPPPIFTGLSGAALQALVGSLIPGAYQGEGITCIESGPMSLLDDQFNWWLGGSSSTWITPTQTITLHHEIYNFTQSIMTYTLSYSSSLDVNWELYDGDWDEPDLNKPLEGPFVVSNIPQNIWFISDPVPLGTEAGPYYLYLRAESVDDPSDIRKTSDYFWIGDWVVPPSEKPPDEGWEIFLPLVVR